MIKVVNKYKEPNHTYCGRGTALSNPFPMEHEDDRDEVCNKYEAYFKEQVEVLNNESMLIELRFIYKEALKGDVNPGCFCSPKRCHCDTIKINIYRKIINYEKNKLTSTQ